MANGRRSRNKIDKNFIASKVQGIRNKLRNITGNTKKTNDCEKMKLEYSEELNPDDFE